MATPEAKRTRLAQADGMEVDAAADRDTLPARDNQQPDPLQQRAMMKTYYRRLFPTQQIFRWLAYGNDAGGPGSDARFPSRRELCFTLDGDVFVRYQSFKNVAELSGALASRVPAKIDIGPVYTCDPRERAKYDKDFRPQQRELVFDIDMTDYDDIRTCCSGGAICSKCWGFMAVAMQVLDAALRSDLGFKHILWVFSGRRGVHCWVADATARLLSDEVRGGVVGYLNVIRGSVGDKPKLAMGGTRHPSLDRAYELLLDAWEQHILPSQRLLELPERIPLLTRFIPEADVVAALHAAWGVGGAGGVDGGGGGGARRASGSRAAAAGEGGLSVRRWHQLVEAVEDKVAQLRASKVHGRASALARAVPDIVFACCYPRLDVDVSKKMNHLLKAPFCVHPKTGKVCVPLDPSRAWEFDPVVDPPTLGALMEQLDAAGGGGGGGGGAAAPGEGGAAPAPGSWSAPDVAKGDNGAGPGSAEAWRGTSMAPHIEAFTSTFLTPLLSASRAALADAARQQQQAEAAAAAAAAASRSPAPVDMSW